VRSVVSGKTGERLGSVGETEDELSVLRSSVSTPEVKAWLRKRPHFHLHFTPTSASWLNAVESWFSQLERRSVQRGNVTSPPALRAELRRYIEAHNLTRREALRLHQERRVDHRDGQAGARGCDAN